MPIGRACKYFLHGGNHSQACVCADKQYGYGRVQQQQRVAITVKHAFVPISSMDMGGFSNSSVWQSRSSMRLRR
ncbi:hypothetical protein LQZ18_14155 [Lachnospiraceae bacterium ZAX-1]